MINNIKSKVALSAITLLATGCLKQELPPVGQTDDKPAPVTTKLEEATPTMTPVAFQSYSSIFQFSSKIPVSWKVEYIAGIESLNIYDPASSGNNKLEQSQIFIRHFKSTDFLTLSTVTIINQEKTTINGHSAIRYEIEKKPGIPNFSGQPQWRNKRHKLIDIRSNNNSPTEFYVFSYTPDLPEDTFEDFIQNLNFSK